MIATKPVNLKARRKDHLDDTFNGRPVIVSEREYYDLLKAKQHNGAIRGIGKPEPLKDDKARLLSRRIDDADRLVYDIDGLQHIRIVSHKGHYAD